jgi:hypothetical protein
MTGWHIRIGYISGDSCDYNQEQAWEILKAEVARLREDTAAIVAELHRLKPLLFRRDTQQMLWELAAAYKAEDGDATLTILEDSREILQMASGDRELKEHVRRAFCRLVLDVMHKYGIDINLSVV